MPSVKAIEPPLDIANVMHSAAFYADMLGFAIGTLWPDDSPQFAILNRDGQHLQLSRRERAPQFLYRILTPPSGLMSRESQICIPPEGKGEDRVGTGSVLLPALEFAFKDPDGHLVILPEVTHDPPTREEAFWLYGYSSIH